MIQLHHPMLRLPVPWWVERLFRLTFWITQPSEDIQWCMIQLLRCDNSRNMPSLTLEEVIIVQITVHLQWAFLIALHLDQWCTTSDPWASSGCDESSCGPRCPTRKV